jgi:hypothetical protein
MLYGRRKRLKDLEAAEAEGRSFWSDELDREARYRLIYATRDLSEGLDNYSFDLVGYARNRTVADLGLPHLANHLSDSRQDAFDAILNADTDVVLSLLEAIMFVSAVVAQGRGTEWSDSNRVKGRLPGFTETVRTVLREHRVSFDLVDGRFIPIEDLEMHEAVVVPALTLLGGRKDLGAVETAYRKALEEIHTGTPDDAITDAGTALQEALIAVGCDGNALGPLINSAQKKGIITGHDKKLLDWVSADRSTTGDAHTVSGASREDAWLAVHVVGAIILRITGGPPRAI